MSNYSGPGALFYEKNAEKQLWFSFQNGERKAFDKLYSSYYALLLNYGYQYCGEKELTADCLHDFFIYIWDHRENLGAVKSIRWYLMSSFRRRLQRYLDKQRKLNHNQEEGYRPGNRVESSIEHRMIQVEEEAYYSHLVKCMMANLSARQKEIVVLRYYQELNPTEISERLGIHYQTVVNHLTTAFKIFRQEYRVR